MDLFFHQEGDRVYICGSLTGTYAEFALCNASSVHSMPDNVSFSQGAAIYVPYFTAYRALFQRCGDVNDINDKHKNFNIVASKCCSRYFCIMLFRDNGKHL